MEQEINGLIEQWQSLRSNTFSFIKELDENELDKLLPREGLNTIRKHFVEMIEVQKDYVKAIKDGVMSFNGSPDSEISGDVSKNQLLENMKEEDEKLIACLKNDTSKRNVNWFGEKKALSYHMSGLIAHEVLHIGQIIAFCYMLNINIPTDVVGDWALSGK